MIMKFICAKRPPPGVLGIGAVSPSGVTNGKQIKETGKMIDGNTPSPGPWSILICPVGQQQAFEEHFIIDANDKKIAKVYAGGPTTANAALLVRANQVERYKDD